MTRKHNLDKLARDAAQVGGEHERLVDAISEEAAARVALLERVVELVRPALAALASQIQGRDAVGLNAVGLKVASDLWLLTDGTFYGATRMTRMLATLAPNQVASTCDVDAIIDVIAKALESHLGKREARTADTLERARKLRAITSLLEGM